MLRITFINVGYGDSILIEELQGAKRTFAILVDGGKPYDQVDRFEYDGHPGRTPVLPYLKSHEVEKLDVVMLTHFHIDHVGGLPDVLKALPYGEIWANCSIPEQFPMGNCVIPENSPPESLAMFRSLSLFSEIKNIARKHGKEIMLFKKHEFGSNLGHGILVDKYAVTPRFNMKMNMLLKGIGSQPPEELETRLFALDQGQNASCIALRVSYAGKSALLASDLPSPYWNSILDEGGHSIRADILKFPHHGQSDGASKRFAAEVDPKHVVFCVSEDNPFGCPKKAAFSYFNPSVHFHSTGYVDVPQLLPPTLPHKAVVFEIADDSTITWFPENA